MVSGTDSEKWVGHRDHNSSTLNFESDYTGPGGKPYLDGPNLLGGGVQATVEDVYNTISQALRQNPSEQINLVGHSRGGLVAILVAKKLKATPPSCSGGQVHFLGLYDAVDRYLLASGSVISDNVDYVAHARRDPGVHSRPFFGNTGTSDGKSYNEAFFWVTHSGAGGDPWGGDHPVRLESIPNTTSGHLPQYRAIPTITEEQNQAGSAAVDAWMRNQARQNGLKGL